MGEGGSPEAVVPLTQAEQAINNPTQAPPLNEPEGTVAPPPQKRPPTTSQAEPVFAR